MRLKTVKVIALLVVAGVLAMACRSTRSGPPANAAVVDVVTNASAARWLQTAIDQFNKANLKTTAGKPVYVTLQTVEAGQAVLNMTSGGAALPALWVPDNQVWASVLAQRGQAGFEGNCVDTTSSPLVLAMWRPIAEALGWPGRSLGWLDLSSLSADPTSWTYYSGGQFGATFRMGHAHPGLSGSGSSTLLAVVQAARSKAAAVTADEVKDPVVQASVSAFEGTIAWFSPSSDKLAQTMAQRGTSYLAASVVYESDVVNLVGTDPGIVIVYPFEGTFVATHPACLNGGADAVTQEAAKVFRDWLLQPDAQKLAVAAGLRPTNSAVQVTAPLDAAHGVDLAQPKTVFAPATAATVFAVGELWQAARKDVNLVMLLDVSGSMRGEKIDSLRQAAVQFVKQMGDRDYLTLITFSSRSTTLIDHQRIGTARDQAIQKIEDIQATGNTSLYDAIVGAAGLIKKTTSSQTNNALIVLSDGQDTSSSSYGLDDAVNAASQNDATVFTIAYGGDADKAVLQRIADQAKGNFYLGTEANIASIYEEMSAAFGGSAGIGR